MFYPNMSSLPTGCKNIIHPVMDSRFVGKTGRFIGMSIVATLAQLFLTAIGLGIFYALNTFVASLFVGSPAELLVVLICAVPAIIFIFAGLAWNLVIRYRWEAKNTIINGFPVYCTAKVWPFALTISKWFFLSIITLTIYAWWLPITARKWKCDHMIVDFGGQVVEVTHVCGAQATMPMAPEMIEQMHKGTPTAAPTGVPMGAPMMAPMGTPIPAPMPIMPPPPPAPMPLPRSLPIMEIPADPHPRRFY